MSAEKVVALVQARMSSRRLPGKVLLPLAGKPMLAWLLERLDHCEGLHGICVATSSASSDDAVASFCTGHGVACHRGDLDNVALRMLGAAEAMQASAFVRLSGDSPLIDASVVSEVVRLYRRERPDLASNVVVRSFPKGQSVEMLKTDTFRTALPHFDDPADNEHVTTYFYRNASQFHIASMQRKLDASTTQLSVDTAEDFARAGRLIAQFTRPHWSYGVDELVSMIGSEPV